MSLAHSHHTSLTSILIFFTVKSLLYLFQHFCYLRGGYLARIEDKSENDFLKNLVKNLESNIYILHICGINVVNILNLASIAERRPNLYRQG